MFDEAIETYTDRRYARFALDAYICKTRYMDRLRNKIFGTEQPALVLIGAASLSPSSPIKKYMRCPGTRTLVKSLEKAKIFDIHYVDEYKTSRVCGLCCAAFEGKTSYRYKICRDCRPLEELKPAKKITSNIPHREKQWRKNKIMPPDHRLTEKFKKFDKTSRLMELMDVDEHEQTKEKAKKTFWHRDSSAARLIMYKGNILRKHWWAHW